jgi:DNA polymerase III epsilon subunit-like protein
MDTVRREAAESTATFLDALRKLAREGKKEDPETKKLWRLIYQIENIRSLPSLHSALEEIVLALLATRVGEYRSVLEDRHEELSDPADDPAVARLAERLGRAMLGRQRVWVESGNGVGIAIRLLLVAGGVTTVEYLLPESHPNPGDLILSEVDAGPLPLPLAVFKAIQLLLGRRLSDELTDFVAFDLETTGKDPADAEVVEVGAVRVRGGVAVESFHSLVRPSVSITPGAQDVHGYSDADVRDAPSFAEVWPRLREFFGEDLVLAHNGFGFDVPVLRRLVAELRGPGREPRFFDTLPLARSLVAGNVKLERLAELFQIDVGRSHHALDDACTLAAVAVGLGRFNQSRLRKTLGVQLLDVLGLGLALLDEERIGKEGALLRDLARPFTLGRYSRCLEDYEQERERLQGETLSLDAVIRRLGGPVLMERIRRERGAEQRYPVAVGRLRTLLAASQAETLEESLERFLDQVALSGSQGVEADPHRVNLLTLHAAKGLEFSRVYIVGVEDYQLPGYYQTRDNRQDEIEESRRLLYVGMTRARDRLVVTRVDQRAGQDAGGSRFLEEMGVEVKRE